MDRNPTSPDRSPADICRWVQFTAEAFREEKSYLPEPFKTGLERAIIINMHNKEREGGTPASQHKVDFATQKQPRREAFRAVEKNLDSAPEKISGAEISRSAPHPQPQGPRAPQASDEYRSIEYAAKLDRALEESFRVAPKPDEALETLEIAIHDYRERHPNNIPPSELFDDEDVG